MKAVVALLALLALIAVGAVGNWIYGLFQPVHLACQGELVMTTYGHDQKFTKNLRVEVDLRNGTVAIEEFLGRFKIERAGENSVFFSQTGAALNSNLEVDNNTGSLDRYTGSIAVYDASGSGDLKRVFQGICHQAAPLF
jgi:hypothetical protein